MSLEANVKVLSEETKTQLLHFGAIVFSKEF